MTTDYAQYKLSVKEKGRFLVVGYAGIFTVLFVFYHSIALSIPGGLLAYLFLDRYSSFLAAKRRALLTTQFKDLLYSLSASIAANRQIAEALADGLENF